MKISDLVKDLQYLHGIHGDVEVELQGENQTDCFFYIIPEEYESEMGVEVIVKLRNWPY